MHAEIVVTGSEIVLGKLVDTNSSHIATQLQSLGIPLHYITVVGDDGARMVAALRIALERAPLVITTGGLGPTVDDVTRAAVAEASGRPLVFHEDLLVQIEGYFRRLGREMSPNNRLQAYLPEGAIVIDNPVGTAPAFIIETGAGALISLPGVPREMMYLMEHSVMPYLRRRFGGDQVMLSRTLHTAGMGESVLDQTLGEELLRSANPAVGLNARAGQVDVRLTATGPDEDACRSLIAPFEDAVRRALGHAVYGADNDTLEGVLLAQISARGQWLATAEAGTRGQLAGRLATAPGAAAAYAGGRVWPDVAALCATLGVPVGDGEALGRGLATALLTAADVDVALVLVAGGNPPRILMALATPEEVSARVLPYASRPEHIGDWGASAALDWGRRKTGS